MSNVVNGAAIITGQLRDLNEAVGDVERAVREQKFPEQVAPQVKVDVPPSQVNFHLPQPIVNFKADQPVVNVTVPVPVVNVAAALVEIPPFVPVPYRVNVTKRDGAGLIEEFTITPIA